MSCEFGEEICTYGGLLEKTRVKNLVTKSFIRVEKNRVFSTGITIYYVTILSTIKLSRHPIHHPPKWLGGGDELQLLANFQKMSHLTVHISIEIIISPLISLIMLMILVIHGAKFLPILSNGHLALFLILSPLH